jgi:5-hydroxyisourate hydrolase
MSPITTHVLDTALGRPAKNIGVTLSRLEENRTWTTLAERATNDDGRVTDLLEEGAFTSGTYRLTFETGPYLVSTTARPAFYPSVDVVFEVPGLDDGGDGEVRHYHVPLLLSPFGYSTYRGS